MCAHHISSPSEWYHSTHGPTHACCPTSYLPSSCEPSPVPRITRPAHYKTSLSSGIHSPSATEKVAEGRVLPEKGPVQDVEVAHQSCEGSWRLWHHAICKEMRCAHILDTTRHLCRPAYIAPPRRKKWRRGEFFRKRAQFKTWRLHTNHVRAHGGCGTMQYVRRCGVLTYLTLQVVRHPHLLALVACRSRRLC